MLSQAYYRQLSEQSQNLVREAAREAEVYTWELVKIKILKWLNLPKVREWDLVTRSIWPDFYFSVEGKELVDNVLGIINEK